MLMCHRQSLKAILILGMILTLVSVPDGRVSGFKAVEPLQPTGPTRLITQGAYVPWVVFYSTELDAFNKLIGKDSGILAVFLSWSGDFDNNQCGFFHLLFSHDQVTRCGDHPPGPEIHTAVMLTWMPVANPVNYPSCRVFVDGRTNLDAIINGSCDGYIDNFATRLKNWSQAHGDVFMIRLMHEMNITDSKWWRDDPNYPAQYVLAYKHVRDRFNLMGATSQYAQFVWSPNYASHPNVSWNAIPRYYPGDAYVDWIGLSGYNWGSTRGSGWKTFTEIYDSPDSNLGNTSVLRYLMCHYAKPIVITEIGSVEGGGGSQTKAAWIADAYSKMQNYPYVRAVTWYNDYAYHQIGQPDFRVTAGSSFDPNVYHYPGHQSALPNWTQAYKTAISGPVFTSVLPPLSSLTPQSTYCGQIPPVEPAPRLVSPDFLLAEPGDMAWGLVTVHDVTTTVSLSVSGLPGGYTASFSPATAGPHVYFPTTSTVQIAINVPVSATPGNLPFTVRATGGGLSPSDTTVLMVYDTLNRVYLPIVHRQ